MTLSLRVAYILTFYRKASLWEMAYLYTTQNKADISCRGHRAKRIEISISEWNDSSVSSAAIGRFSTDCFCSWGGSSFPGTPRGHRAQWPALCIIHSSVLHQNLTRSRSRGEEGSQRLFRQSLDQNPDAEDTSQGVMVHLTCQRNCAQGCGE